METMNLRRKDTTKGPPLRILSLDGGGVRGYSMLVILKRLMHKCFVEAEGRAPAEEEIPKPCDYFDLIGGTGTGGLIAIMLGRLQMDLETCMIVYGRMTRVVFETDKTFAGIPYKQTLFKASKLEEAIKACVREHTIYDTEGNDEPMVDLTSPTSTQMMSPMTPADVRRSMSVKSNSSLPLSHPQSLNRNSTSLGYGARLWGNPDASLYDRREKRTKTCVTAVYKGTNPKTGSSVLLRSYDSRKEPRPEFKCSIWQAGRATSATGLAFKPIQIGHSIFIDEGAGKYNPAPQILEEAVTNEWPGRDLGIFVSVGTGKRPGGTNRAQQEWWEGFVGGTVGNFAEARRRLIAKIEGCEDTHVQMMNVELPRRGIPVENYCRLNVEVGVGEFGMNEWDRLSDIQTNTYRYLAKKETNAALDDAARKMAKIELVKRRMEQPQLRRESDVHKNLPVAPPHGAQQPQHHWPAAVELPGDDPSPSMLSPSTNNTYSYHSQTASSVSYASNDYRTASESGDKFMVIPNDLSGQRVSAELPHRTSFDGVNTAGGYASQQVTQHAPPLPPKTPLNAPALPYRNPPLPPSSAGNRTSAPSALPRPPYPDDEPPPQVNWWRRPEYVPR